MSAPSLQSREEIERTLATLRAALAKQPPDAPAAIAFRLAIARNEQKIMQMGGLTAC